MKQIWKYLVEVTDEQVIEMPAGAKILTVQMQRDIPHIWVCVGPHNKTELRQIRIYGTGHNVSNPENLKYISTFQMRGGSLVFHAFEYVR